MRHPRPLGRYRKAPVVRPQRGLVRPAKITCYMDADPAEVMAQARASRCGNVLLAKLRSSDAPTPSSVDDGGSVSKSGTTRRSFVRLGCCEIPLKAYHKYIASVEREVDAQFTPNVDDYTGYVIKDSIRICTIDPDAPDSIARVHNLDAPVLPFKFVTLQIDYPMERSFQHVIKAAGDEITRRDLLLGLHTAYTYVYAAEEASTQNPVVPPDERVGLLNRNCTNGQYGIYGHDLSDLYFEDAFYVTYPTDNSFPIVVPAMGS